jgi:hypothetical protein
MLVEFRTSFCAAVEAEVNEQEGGKFLRLAHYM